MNRRETVLLLVLGLVAVYSVTAAAGNTGPGTPTCQGSTCVQPTPGGYVVNVYDDSRTAAAAVAHSTATSRSASAAQSGATATGGSATAQGGAGGNAAVTVNTAAPSRRTTELRTVGIAPDISANATAPCRIALGAGGGWMGSALSIFGSTLDEGCDARADAAMLMAIGRNDAAVARLCQKAETAKALGCEAEALGTDVPHRR